VGEWPEHCDGIGEIGRSFDGRGQVGPAGPGGDEYRVVPPEAARLNLARIGGAFRVGPDDDGVGPGPADGGGERRRGHPGAEQAAVTALFGQRGRERFEGESVLFFRRTGEQQSRLL
jgi:hypothetical protein